MGVLDFFKIKILNKDSKFYEKLISSLGESVKLELFKNKKICIDASLIIYQSILAMQRIDGLVDKNGNTTVHINTIFNKIIQLKQAGITQIWIFDSPTQNKMKEKEIEKRKKRKENMKKKSDEKGEESKIYSLKSEHVEEIQLLLKYMGIMYMTAPSGIEAEQYGAKLTAGEENERYCDYMLSGDSDVLLFGGNLLKISSEKSATGKTKKTTYYTYDLQNILSELGLSYDDFVNMGVVLGTDFNEKAIGVGAAAVMKKFQNVKLTQDMKDAIDYFKSDITDIMNQADIVEGDYDRNKLLEFLLSKNFNKERIDKRLDEFENKIQKKSQKK